MPGDEILLQVGKRGVTEATIEEARTLGRKHGRIKVRILHSAPEAADRKAAIDALALAAGLRVVRRIGFTAILQK